MHYANGREAKNGDQVVWRPPFPGSVPVVGVLYGAVAGNDYCNGRLAVPHSTDPYPNLRECLHIEDALVTLPTQPPPATEVGAK